MSFDNLMAEALTHEVHNPVTSNAIRDIIIDDITYKLGDPTTFGTEEPRKPGLASHVVQLLVDAYSDAVLDEHQKGGEVTFVRAACAEQVLRNAEVAAYKEVCKRGEAYAEDNLPPWPDDLSYTAEYPESFLKYLGYIIGHNAGMKSKIYYNMCRSERK